LLKEALDRLLGKPEFQLPLETSLPRTERLEAPGLLRFSLCQTGGAPLVAAVEKGAEVSAGDLLAEGVGELSSPVSGKVTAVIEQPDIRGCRKGSAVIVEPSGPAPESVFEPLDPEKEGPERLAERLREAGVLSATRTPRPLLGELRPGGDAKVETVVVLAADRDPGVSVALHLLRSRGAEAVAAARLLGRIAGAGRIVLAALEGETAGLGTDAGVEVLALEAIYPATLSGMVRRRLGGGAGIAVVPLESALAALDAVAHGRIQSAKWITLIGPDQRPVANCLVPLGTTIREVLEHAGLRPGERDKVVAGGPMRGFAVHSLGGAIDAGVDALTLIPAGMYPRWTTDPCINCGRCIDRCPIHLQVQLISRYSEFGLFDRTPEYDIDQCFECGLCASVCTANRPLLQYIRLAKEQLEVKA